MIPIITVSEAFSGIGRSGTSELKESEGSAKESGGFQEFLDRLKQKEAAPEEARQKAEKPAGEKEKEALREKPVQEKPVKEKPVKEKPVKEKPVKETAEEELSEAVEKKKEEAVKTAEDNQKKRLNNFSKKILPEKKTGSPLPSRKQEQGSAAEITGEMTAQMSAQLRNPEEGAEKPENMAAKEEGASLKKEFSREAPEQLSSRSLKSEGPATLQVTDLRKAVKPGEKKAGDGPEKTIKKGGENGKSAERDLRLAAGEEKQEIRTGDVRKGFGAEEKRTGRVEVSQSGSEEKGDTKTIHVNLTSADEAAGKGKSGEPAQAARQLSSRLQEDLSAKIVKHASIVVKSERSGEIKLILHPENLGRVRIQLQLEDNRIAGRIFVDNTSVREAFEGNLKNLERAFQQDGFDSAKLEVFVGDRKQDQRRAGSDKHPAGFAGPDKAAAVDKLGTSVPSMERYYADGDTLIDLVV